MTKELKKKSKSRTKSDQTIQNKDFGIERINEIITRLKDPTNGCPWDQIQTNKSLAKHTVEEAYEVMSAIDSEENVEVCQELGDLLFNILFHSYIANEKGLFSFDDIVENVVQKMVTRHPHVFGTKKLSSVKEVNEQWEKLKREEKNINEFGRMENEINALTTNLPALTYAKKIQEKVASIGFDWDASFEVINKIYEEIDELVTAEETNNRESEFEEFGDLLFSVINLGRFKRIDPEMALRAANKKFIKRFLEVERHLNKSGISIERSNKSEMNSIWQKIKDRH